MALENLVGADKYLSALVPANPVGGDDKREGDDHIRGIKNTLKNTFPNLTGVVTATQAELSSVAGKVAKAGDAMTGALAITAGGVALQVNGNATVGGRLLVNGGLLTLGVQINPGDTLGLAHLYPGGLTVMSATGTIILPAGVFPQGAQIWLAVASFAITLTVNTAACTIYQNGAVVPSPLTLASVRQGLLTALGGDGFYWHPM